jgi:hypothetical protein
MGINLDHDYYEKNVIKRMIRTHCLQQKYLQKQGGTM